RPPDAERRRLRALIAEADLGVTGADLAVAETGTLVLVSAAGRPRTTSLLPPCHVAAFDRTALVESLEQVGLVLEASPDGPAPPCPSPPPLRPAGAPAPSGAGSARWPPRPPSASPARTSPGPTPARWSSARQPDGHAPRRRGRRATSRSSIGPRWWGWWTRP